VVQQDGSYYFWDTVIVRVQKEELRVCEKNMYVIVEPGTSTGTGKLVSLDALIREYQHWIIVAACTHENPKNMQLFSSPSDYNRTFPNIVESDKEYVEVTLPFTDDQRKIVEKHKCDSEQKTKSTIFPTINLKSTSIISQLRKEDFPVFQTDQLERKPEPKGMTPAPREICYTLNTYKTKQQKEQLFDGKYFPPKTWNETNETRQTPQQLVNAVKEKLAFDLYKEFSCGTFAVRHCLFDITKNSNAFVLQVLISHDPRSFSFDRIQAIIPGNTLVSLKQCLLVHGMVPSKVVDPTETRHIKPIELKGFASALAVGKCLGNTNFLDSCEIQLQKKSDGTTEAVVVVVKLENCFSFPGSGACGIDGSLKDIQIDEENGKIIWSKLSPSNQTEFICRLMDISRNLNEEHQLKRSSHFVQLSQIDRFTPPKDLLKCQLFQNIHKDFPHWPDDTFLENCGRWLYFQFQFYCQEMEEFKRNFPDEIIKCNYLDNGENVFHPSMIVDHVDVKEPTYRVKDLETTSGLSDKLFTTPIKPSGEAPRKYLFLEPSNVRITCRKIAYSWASGKLLNGIFKHVYWLQLDKAKFQESCSYTEIDAIAATIQKQLLLHEATKNEIAMNLMGEDCLLLLDGICDSQDLFNLIQRLLKLDLKVIVTLTEEVFSQFSEHKLQSLEPIQFHRIARLAENKQEQETKPSNSPKPQTTAETTRQVEMRSQHPQVANCAIM